MHQPHEPGVLEYLNAIGRVPLLAAADEYRLGERIDAARTAQERLHTRPSLDPAERTRLDEQVESGALARAEMIRANLRLVVSLAQRHGSRRVPLSDLIQEGNLGLMRAVERFDHRRGFRFSTYATWWIRQALSRAASRHRTIPIPQQSYDQLIRCWRASTAIEERRGRAATTAEIAEAADLTEQRVRDLLRCTMQPIALEPGDESILDVLDDSTGDPWQIVRAADVRHRIGALIASLPDDAGAIVRLRFGFDGAPLTMAEVAKRIGMPVHLVRQHERSALECFRRAPLVSRMDLDDPA